MNRAPDPAREQTIPVRGVVEQLRRLGVTPGSVLLVHTSFRAVRPVEGGPSGLIAALTEAIGPDGTLVMPSSTGDDDAVFNPAATPADPALGIVPETFRKFPGVLRSAHPMAVAARGPLAARIADAPLVLPPCGDDSAYHRIVACGGWVLLLGVGQDANTTIHRAELERFARKLTRMDSQGL